jgi:transcriptional regulator with XRE-family HTH domain
MPRTLRSPRHEALRAYLVEAREKAGLTQAAVAARLGKQQGARVHQSFVARVESGQRRLDVVELLDFAEALRFEPREVLKRLRAR